ncbi:MAG: hypothetical protein ACM357_00080 [Gemmatimonadota bacterium]
MNERRTVRGGLLALALVFLAWEAFGAARWVIAAGGPGPAASQLWAHLRSDWMLLVVVTDHLLLAAIVLVVVWVDATKAGWSIGRRLGLTAAFVALGSPAILWYVARRLQTPGLETRSDAEAGA